MNSKNFIIGRQTGDTISWHAHSLENSNACCLYCGTSLRSPSPPESDKEHLIGRNFVPKGTMGDQQFNFIFRTCRRCNARKAVAERHVSSVTLFNSPGRFENAQVNEVAIRKGKSDFHPKKKGVRIEDAYEHCFLSTSLGPGSIEFGMIAPPQLEKNLAKNAAFSHIQGLFALLCTEDYRDPLKMRLLSLDQFLWFDYYFYNDWGNPQAIEIANRVLGWDCYANIVSAKGYFKAIMRRCDEGWFWALEWNRQLRILGGISSSRMKLFEVLPDEDWTRTPQGRIRRDTPLNAKVDNLFSGTVLG